MGKVSQKRLKLLYKSAHLEFLHGEASRWIDYCTLDVDTGIAWWCIQMDLYIGKLDVPTGFASTKLTAAKALSQPTIQQVCNCYIK